MVLLDFLVVDLLEVYYLRNLLDLKHNILLLHLILQFHPLQYILHLFLHLLM